MEGVHHEPDGLKGGLSRTFSFLSESVAGAGWIPPGGKVFSAVCLG